MGPTGTVQSAPQNALALEENGRLVSHANVHQPFVQLKRATVILAGGEVNEVLNPATRPVRNEVTAA